MKIRKMFTLDEVASKTLYAIINRDLNGVYPSDIDGDWHWHIIESGGFPYGVYLRFRVDRNCRCYAMSFNDAGYDAVYDDYYNVLGYVKREDTGK